MKNNNEIVSIRLVLDSNVWISALISPHGNSARIVRGVLSDDPSGIISGYIMGEIDRALSKGWFSERYGIKESHILEYLSIIHSCLEIVTPAEVSFTVRDPKDLPVIGTAIAGKASHLVTGDHHLLDDVELKRWMLEQEIEIVSPSEFSI